MFDWLRRLFGGDPHSTLREQVEEARLRAELRAVQATEALFDLVDPREPYYDDSPDWVPIGGEHVPRNVDSRKRGEVLPVYLTEGGLKAIRDRSRELCAYNAHAINAKENRVSYTIGKGLSYKVAPRVTRPDGSAGVGQRPGDEQLEAWAEQAQSVVDDFLVASSWGEREQETLLRCDEDGEAIIRLFHVGGGRADVRFVEPEHVRSPDGEGDTTSSLGVESRPGDVEDVLRYWIVERPDMAVDSPVPVPAEEIVHLKLNVRSTAKRGYPTFWPVKDNLERADRLLRNMGTLAAVRATYALIIKRQHSASAISAHSQAQADGERIDPLTGRARKFTRRLPGGVVETDGRSEYEFPGANLSSADYVALYEAELRAIAARLNMPEYMLTANAANNNYASILVAESPSSKNFERLQAYLFGRFGAGTWAGSRKSGVLWRVLKIASDYGLIDRRCLPWLSIQIEGPPVVVKDKYKETERAKVLSEAGLLSDQTWSSWETLDHEQEQANREREEEERGAGSEQSREQAEKQSVVELQKAFYSGSLPREAAIASAHVVFGFGPEEAELLFPDVEIPRREEANKKQDQAQEEPGDEEGNGNAGAGS